MVSIKTNQFVSSVSFPTPEASNDPLQFGGSQLNLDASQCKKPYSNAVGERYCLDLCVNTCPELNPDQALETAEQIIAIKADTRNLEDASQLSLDMLAAQTSPISVSGAVSFAFAAGLPVVAIQNATVAIQQFIQSSPFDTKANV